MLPGPIYIYKCPNCGQLIKNNSLRSGNTLRSKLYSDGIIISPMLPEYPNFVRCKKCHYFYWLNKAEVVGTYSWGEEQNPDWVDVEFAKFPTIDDYIEAIELNMAPTRDAELSFRRNILWAFNDRVRNGKDLFANDGDQVKWISNTERFIEILDVEDVNEKILLAEVYRSQGEFEKCMDLLNSLDAESFGWLKEAFEKECQAKNKLVFSLN
jgi:hypothetical protein